MDNKRYKKCIKCGSYANNKYMCYVCEKTVCKNCFFGNGMCKECMIETQPEKLVNDYFVDKNGVQHEI